MDKIVKKPWGNYQIIEKAQNYIVKKISVIPNSKLSLQSHEFRSEHWIVAQGIAHITLWDKNLILKENEHVFIPNKIKHRLSNNNHLDLIIIEVWYGKILQEDDITRYEDIYNRIWFW